LGRSASFLLHQAPDRLVLGRVVDPQVLLEDLPTDGGAQDVLGVVVGARGDLAMRSSSRRKASCTVNIMVMSRLKVLLLVHAYLPCSGAPTLTGHHGNYQ